MSSRKDGDGFFFMRGAGSFAAAGIDPDGDRAIVDEGDLHVCAEDSRGDRLTAFAREVPAELRKERQGSFRPRSADERRTIALPDGGMECELADREEIATGFRDRTVHEAVVVREDAELCDLCCEPEGIVWAVIVFDAHEQKESRANRGMEFGIDRDRSRKDALEEDPHE